MRVIASAAHRTWHCGSHGGGSAERDNGVSQFPTIVRHVTERRFPAPWTAEEYRGISYIVRDANNFPVAYIYFDKPGRRSAGNMMTQDEAQRVAAGIAKMPELIGKAVSKG
jgi:hypothetical protein